MNRTAEYLFTIIVPVYNEEDSLAALGRRLAAFLTHCLQKACVLFVDDASTDSSQDMLMAMCAENPDFMYISFERNSGLSAALKAGFDNCFSLYCGYMDADLQTDPEDFNLLLEHIAGYSMVTGVRAHRNDSGWRKLQSSFANGFRRMFTRDGAADSCCPLKVFKTESARLFPVFNGMHRFFPALVLLQEEGSYLEIPVRHYPRACGKSKFGFWNRLCGPASDCLAYCWMKARRTSYHIKSSGL